MYDGRLDLLKTVNERVFYFINANVEFIIDGEKVQFEDVLVNNAGAIIRPGGWKEILILI